MGTEGDIAKMQLLLAEKDAMIIALKDKAKDFVNRMKDVHSKELQQLEASLKAGMIETVAKLKTDMAAKDALMERWQANEAMKAEDAKRLSTVLQEKDAEEKKLRRENDNFKADITAVNAKLIDKESKTDELIKSYNASYTKLQAEAQAKAAQAAGLEERLALLEKQARKAAEDSNELCAQLQSQLTDMLAAFQNKSDEVTQLQERLTHLQCMPQSDSSDDLSTALCMVQADLTAKVAEVSALQERIIHLEDSSSKTISVLTSQLQQTTSKLDKASTECDLLKSDITAVNAKLIDKESKTDELIKSYNASYTKLQAEAQAKAAQAAGLEERLALLEKQAGKAAEDSKTAIGDLMFQVQSKAADLALASKEIERLKSVSENAMGSEAKLSEILVLNDTINVENNALKEEIKSENIKFDNERIEIIKSFSEQINKLETSLQTKIDSISILERESVASSQNKITITSLKSELDVRLDEINSALSKVTTHKLEIDNLKTQLGNMTDSYNDIRKEKEALSDKCAFIFKELEDEKSQNLNRKEKIKIKFGQMVEEKKCSDELLALKDAELSKSNAIIDALRSSLLQMKEENIAAGVSHDKKISALIADSSSKEVSLLSRIAGLDEEIRCMGERISFISSQDTAKDAEARCEAERRARELEEHKSKRLVARNEIVGLAATLDQASSDNEELRRFLKSTVGPAVHENITMLESLISSIDIIFSTLSSKKSVKMKAKLERILNQKGSSAGAADSAFSDGCNMTGSIHSAGMSVTKSQQDLSSLCRDLERAKIGILLLSQSVERLSDVVIVDSRCCGSAVDTFFASLAGVLAGNSSDTHIGASSRRSSDASLLHSNSSNNSSKSTDLFGSTDSNDNELDLVKKFNRFALKTKRSLAKGYVKVEARDGLTPEKSEISSHNATVFFIKGAEEDFR